MANLVKEKLSENVRVNFNHSKEIAYWTKKYNISPQLFQKAFNESGHSIAKTLEFVTRHFGGSI